MRVSAAIPGVNSRYIHGQPAGMVEDLLKSLARESGTFAFWGNTKRKWGSSFLLLKQCNFFCPVFDDHRKKALRNLFSFSLGYGLGMGIFVTMCKLHLRGFKKHLSELISKLPLRARGSCLHEVFAIRCQKYSV